jgi:L-cysteine S-thiosulfotransferase
VKHAGPALLSVGLAFFSSAASTQDQRLPGTSPGDPLRGRTIVADRQVGLCLLCHQAPIPEERFQGDLAPDLARVGARRSVAELRDRVTDARRFNPQTIMPPYLTSDGLARVGTSWQGKALLSPQQIEDVVAYLATLRG